MSGRWRADVNVTLACHGWLLSGMSNCAPRAPLPATCCAVACREKNASPPRGFPLTVVAVGGELPAGVDGVMPNSRPIAAKSAEFLSSEKLALTSVRYGLKTAVSLDGDPRNSE